MGKRMNEWRRRKTAKVTVNRYKGRSQKGCFGGTSGFFASGRVYIKEEK